ncbi:MAG: aldehyde dehydrogenase family protein [Pseudomonadota bacterium]|nr:aldehyde dehydrogenase family protein [Pseudomonadota bacterium]
MTEHHPLASSEQAFDTALGSPVQDVNAEEAAAIFNQAARAHRRLAELPIDVRLDGLRKLLDYLVEHRDEAIDILCRETRKCRTDALVSEVLGVLDNVEWLLKNARKVLSEKKVSTPITLLGKKSRIVHEPLGTVLIIAPWNYPLHIGLTSILAAYVCGNAVVYKPSELTPMQGLFEKLFQVDPILGDSIQVVYGTGATAQQLIRQKPAKVFFTGSARTGRKILAQCAELLVPVDLELGGKDQAIVFDDVHLDRAVKGVLWGALTNAGQSCSSVERVYVQDTLYPAFVQRAKEEIDKLVVNSGDLGNADIGGMTADFQLDIVHQQVVDARAKGAKVVCGGSTLVENELFYLPTLLTNVDSSMLIMQQETFGPLVPIVPFSTEEEVVTLSNSTEFGLSASVWSRDLQRANRVARRLECGAVSINNVMLTEGNPALPFGGTKASGYGRQKGVEGLLGYTRSKSLLIDSDSSKIEPNWYPYTRAKYQLFDQLIQVLFSHSPWKLIKAAVIGMKLESLGSKDR